jgi:hypothetical protein
VRWLTAVSEDVPGDDGWLGPRERGVLAGLDGERRRADWRLGRWAAKRLLANDDVELLPAADGAPEAWRGDRDVVPFVAWEAAAKALRRGLLDGARPAVDVDAGGSAFTVRWTGGPEVRGTWWVDDGWALAVASVT